MRITRFIAASGLGSRNQKERIAREQTKNKSYARSKVTCNAQSNYVAADGKIVSCGG